VCVWRKERREGLRGLYSVRITTAGIERVAEQSSRVRALKTAFSSDAQHHDSEIAVNGVQLTCKYR
jgi:hypothetical protein